MRTTVTIEDSLYEQDLEVADLQMDKSSLFREAIKTFIRAQVLRTARRPAATAAAHGATTTKRGK